MHVGRWIRGSRVAAVLASAVLAAATLIAARPAAADAGSYRAPVVATDLGAYALCVSGIVGQMEPLMVASIVGYAFGAPGIHALHGNWERAGLSLGARIGAPLVLGVVGCKFAQSGSSSSIGRSDRCTLGGVAGAAVGVLAAQIFDWAVLAGGYEDTTPQMFTLGGTF